MVRFHEGSHSCRESGMAGGILEPRRKSRLQQARETGMANPEQGVLAVQPCATPRVLWEAGGSVEQCSSSARGTPH